MQLPTAFEIKERQYVRPKLLIFLTKFIGRYDNRRQPSRPLKEFDAIDKVRAP
jgi:hypothetical protein